MGERIMDERIKYLYIEILKYGREFCTHPGFGKGTYSDHERVEVKYEYVHPHNGDPHWGTLFCLADPQGTWLQDHRGRWWFPILKGF